MQTLLTVTVLLFGISGSSIAGFDKAAEAYNKGDFKTAFKEFQSLARQGDAEAQLILGNMYINGNGTSKNDKKGVEWFRKAAEQGDASAQYSLGVMHSDGRGTIKDIQEGMKWYLKAAEQGDAIAQSNIGLQRFTRKDYKGAVFWFHKAAKQGDETSQYGLAVIYCQGLGVKANDDLARKWFMKLTQSSGPLQDRAKEAVNNIDRDCNGEIGPNDAVEQYNLAYQYATGEGKPQNYKKAYKWFLKSATQGDAGAENWIGVLFNNGEGVEQDEELANYWFERSADNGDAYGQYNIAERYYWGTGVSRDYIKATEYLKKSAAQDHIEAQIKLGEMYESGQGVLKNYRAAGKLYKKAAKQDSPEAYIKLASLMLTAIDEKVVIPEDAEEKRRHFGKVAKAINKAFDLSDEGSEMHNSAKEMWDKYQLWKYPY